jgi:hypothetical protein
MQTDWVGDAASYAINDLDEAVFQSLYGRWDPLSLAR